MDVGQNSNMSKILFECAMFYIGSWVCQGFMIDVPKPPSCGNAQFLQDEPGRLIPYKTLTVARVGGSTDVTHQIRWLHIPDDDDDDYRDYSDACSPSCIYDLLVWGICISDIIVFPAAVDMHIVIVAEFVTYLLRYRIYRTFYLICPKPSRAHTSACRRSV